jgi:tripartite-type tricarboxylate transporter receptor subunit TctC
MEQMICARSAGRMAAVLALSLGWAALAAAQTYPAKPIRIVVPQPPGGSTDLVARPLAKHFTEAMGQSVVVENRPGAGSLIGTDLVAKAQPDGYTLLMVAASFTINPSLHKQLPFDPVNDFAPIALLSSFPNLLVVHPSVPVKSVAELIALAKAKPGALNYGSSGVATGTHLSMEMFKHMAGVAIVHVPFKGGPPSVNALVGGQVHVNMATISTAMPHVKSGALRALAVSSSRRAASLPEVPTVAEAGVPGYDYSSWVGLLAPARIPRAIAERLSAESAKGVQAPEIRKILALEGADPVGSTPEDFAALIRREIASWKRIVEAAGIKSD